MLTARLHAYYDALADQLGSAMSRAYDQGDLDAAIIAAGVGPSG